MPVQVYLMRHGIAADPVEYATDGDRPLTAKGGAKTQAVAHQLKAFGLQCDEILTSPLVRAQQTADILFQANLANQLNVTETLAPGGSFSDWLHWLNAERQPPLQSLLLVGHEPDLSQWAELLVWGEVKSVLTLKKAGIMGITIPNTLNPIGNSILFWLTPPRFLVLS
jgi:phosphohistidine phosphatase